MARKPTRYRFTKADCQRGYQATLAKAMKDAQLYGWFFRRVRSHYRAKRRAER